MSQDFYINKQEKIDERSLESMEISSDQLPVILCNYRNALNHFLQRSVLVAPLWSITWIRKEKRKRFPEGERGPGIITAL